MARDVRRASRWQAAERHRPVAHRQRDEDVHRRDGAVARRGGIGRPRCTRRLVPRADPRSGQRDRSPAAQSHQRDRRPLRTGDADSAGRSVPAAVVGRGPRPRRMEPAARHGIRILEHQLLPARPAGRGGDGEPLQRGAGEALRQPVRADAVATRPRRRSGAAGGVVHLILHLGRDGFHGSRPGALGPRPLWRRGALGRDDLGDGAVRSRSGVQPWRAAADRRRSHGDRALRAPVRHDEPPGVPAGGAGVDRDRGHRTARGSPRRARQRLRRTFPPRHDPVGRAPARTGARSQAACRSGLRCHRRW